MEKCPKCGEWRFSLDKFRKELRCYNPRCDYRRKLTEKQLEREMDKRDVLSKLVG